MDTHYVEIVEQGTQKVEKRMGPFNMNKAEKVQSGVEINLNFEMYYTRIVSDGNP